jgi:hypothetical protein
VVALNGQQTLQEAPAAVEKVAILLPVNLELQTPAAVVAVEMTAAAVTVDPASSFCVTQISLPSVEVLV